MTEPISPNAAFREAHERLDDALMETIEALTDAAASLKVYGEPDRAAIRDALGASAEAVDALRVALEAVADGLAGEPQNRRSLLETVEACEPPLEQRSAVGAARARPGDVGGIGEGPFREESSEVPETGPPAEAAGDLRETTAMAKLMAPYGIAVNLESDLFRDRVRRPYMLREFKKGWSEVRFLREREAGAGLVERLQRFYDVVSSAVAGESDGDVDAEPWSHADRRALEAISEQFAELSELDDSEIQRRHRDDWLERVERWLETAESEPEAVAHMTEMLTRFATDIPRRPDAEVQTAAQRMMALEGVPDEIVTRLERAISRA